MRLFQLFADLLDYPTPDLARQAGVCAGATAAVAPQAAALLGRFGAHVGAASPAHLEELYTATFDLKPACSPYVGYHLFGESYKRGAFLARLNAEYQARSFAPGNELPDHVAVALRFLATDGDTEFSRVLLREGLRPALEKMAGSLGDEGANPYGHVLRALLLVLQSVGSE